MSGDPARERFNEMLVDIDVALFELQKKMARFIGALFDEMNSDRAGLDMSLSHQDADGCRAVHCSEIYYDAESEVFMLSVKGRDAPFPWDDIGIGDQYLIVQQLFVRHVADSLYDNLS